MASLGKNFRDTLKKLARQTPVDQLVKSGVKEVKVVGLDHIASLIEEAVHRSLRSKLMGMDRAQLAGEAREEFMRLLQSHQTLAEIARRGAAQEGRGRGRGRSGAAPAGGAEPAPAGEAGHAEEDLRAQHEGENSEILEQVNNLFLQLPDDPDAGVADLRNRVLELVMHVVGEERKTAIAARQVAHNREVEVLERRIDKLKGSLEATEHNLARLSDGGQVEPGISSIYREVQGLDHADTHFERKRTLMADIFRANVALQKGAVSDN